MQKAKSTIDSIEQVSSLIVASANIFKALSPIPFIGVPLAITTIGAMFTAFAASKAAAAQSVNKAESGQRVARGRRHSSGGNKYRSIDGNDPNILEIEEGEWVINRDSSEKYDDLLGAINDDELPWWPGQKFPVLRPIGLQFNPEEREKIQQTINQSNNNGGGYTPLSAEFLSALHKNNELLSQLVNNANNGTEQFNGFRIERFGNHIRKINDQE